MKTNLTSASLVLVALCFAGCSDSGYQDYGQAPLSDGHAHTHDHDHTHGQHTGKNGGHVLELDDAHGHHAEMVFDKSSRDITLYFYGSEIGVAKPATGLAFEIKKDGKEAVLKASPKPLEGETEETCSRYVISGSELPAAMTSEEQLDGHFHIMIDGREFVGGFHAHSHDEHGTEPVNEAQDAGESAHGRVVDPQ